MAKVLKDIVKLQVDAGKATPAPPVGTALGPKGINISEFVTKYNDATRDKMGQVIPVEIYIYEDRSFDFVLKTPPAAVLIKQAAKVEKGSTKGSTYVVGSITREQLKEIATIKLPDLTANSIEAAMRSVEGTALNMGIEIVD